MAGIDFEHVNTLAGAGRTLPPITVARSSMRVVDGMHRVAAARLNGQPRIAARFFDGTDDDAFLLATEVNTAHGLPLTLADRRAAATRIIGSHPQMSDRSIGLIVALASKTIAALRRRATGEIPQLHTRVGRDGRVRPLNITEGRLMACEIIAAKPNASLREIAKEAGISVGTARDVRNRVQAGEDPIPNGRRPASESRRRTASRPAEPVDPRSVLDRLRKDPSLRFTESGRRILRWLTAHMIAAPDWEALTEELPPHCGPLVVALARACAASWLELADELERGAGESG
ncbi:ParB N-terminal domain-containing protein [Acrocarpospora corrugata]|uniref:ParB N-terminal domain-containing protein n=1 Tax=Acrocarpospora corrugata TaxID=35763 RepID=UPI001C3FDA9D|nr:ParB N-terminal domain-containing protein [Acrocarpospora corrugata]